MVAHLTGIIKFLPHTGCSRSSLEWSVVPNFGFESFQAKSTAMYAIADASGPGLHVPSRRDPSGSD